MIRLIQIFGAILLAPVIAIAFYLLVWLICLIINYIDENT